MHDYFAQILRPVNLFTDRLKPIWLKQTIRTLSGFRPRSLNPDFPLDRYNFVVMLMDINCQAKHTFANCVQRYEVNRTFFNSPGLRCSYLQRAGCGGRRALPDNLKKARLTPF